MRLAWGYAGAVPEPIPWTYTGALFREVSDQSTAQKAVVAASEVDDVHPDLLGSMNITFRFQKSIRASNTDV